MSDVIHIKAAEIIGRQKSEHEGYEYTKRELVSKGAAKQCAVSLYEIQPGKSAYPYHYHMQNEESFYILSGSGVLKTPEGKRDVSAGDFLFFPANEKGAHKLTNSSDTEMLIYLDFDTYNEVDVTLYPDSGKIGIWGNGVNQVYKEDCQSDYYEGE